MGNAYRKSFINKGLQRFRSGFKSRRLDQNSRITIGGTAVFDSTACDGERGWKPFCGSKTLCLTSLDYEKLDGKGRR